MHSTGSSTLCQGSLIFCTRKSLVAVQHSTGRRTLCQGSLLHSHSSPGLGLQLTGTSASGIPSLEDRLGQSWCRRDCELCSGTITEPCLLDMLYDSVGDLVLGPLKEREYTKSRIGKYQRRKNSFQYLVLRELGSVDRILNRKVQH